MIAAKSIVDASLPSTIVQDRPVTFAPPIAAMIGWIRLSAMRGHDGGERGTDDHRDRQVDDVPAHQEVLEPLQHVQAPFVGTRAESTQRNGDRLSQGDRRESRRRLPRHCDDHQPAGSARRSAWRRPARPREPSRTVASAASSTACEPPSGAAVTTSTCAPGVSSAATSGSASRNGHGDRVRVAGREAAVLPAHQAGAGHRLAAARGPASTRPVACSAAVSAAARA